MKIEYTRSQLEDILALAEAALHNMHRRKHQLDEEIEVAREDVQFATTRLAQMEVPRDGT